MRLYVAYGSNLNLDQMEYRCPRAKIFAKGIIPNYRLVFRGSKTGSYATIIPAEGYSVPVLVWDITPTDELSLDIYEGYPTFYYKEDVTVKLDSGESISAMAYIMFNEAKVGKPSPRYLATISAGYSANGLDTSAFYEAIDYNRLEMSL
jgi:hypothetical protein